MAIRWENVDFGRSLPTVSSSLDARDVLKTTKTEAGMRTIPLPALVADALTTWQPFVVPEARGLIFRTQTGGILRAADFYADLWHPVFGKG